MSLFQPIAPPPATWDDWSMLAEERDLLIPSPATDYHSSSAWIMAAIAALALLAAVFVFRWLSHRAGDQH